MSGAGGSDGRLAMTAAASSQAFTREYLFDVRATTERPAVAACLAIDPAVPSPPAY